MSRSNASKDEDSSDGKHGKHGKFIADFQHKWSEALRDASVAREMTDTPAWRSIYHAHQEIYRAQRKAVADRLVPMLEQLQRSGWDEESEKEAKELIKSAVESREVDEAFKSTTLKQVTDSVAACDKAIADATYAAEDLERCHGLTALGIADALQVEVQETLSVSFDYESGRVIIKPRR